MPIKYLPIAPTTIEIFFELIKVLSPRITKLEKLRETKKETLYYKQETMKFGFINLTY
jgi:hypothetical protein